MPASAARKVEQFTKKPWKEPQIEEQERKMPSMRGTFVGRLGNFARNLFGLRQRKFTREYLALESQAHSLWRQRHFDSFSRSREYVSSLQHARDISEAAEHNVGYFRRLADAGSEHASEYRQIASLLETNPNLFRNLFVRDIQANDSSILNAFKNLRGFSIAMSRRKINRIFDEHSPGITQALMHVYERHHAGKRILETLRAVHFNTPSEEQSSAEHGEVGHEVHHAPPGGIYGGEEREQGGNQGLDEMFRQFQQHQEGGKQGPIVINVSPTFSPVISPNQTQTANPTSTSNPIVSPRISPTNSARYNPTFSNRPEINRKVTSTYSRTGVTAEEIKQLSAAFRKYAANVKVVPQQQASRRPSGILLTKKETLAFITILEKSRSKEAAQLRKLLAGANKNANVSVSIKQ